MAEQAFLAITEANPEEALAWYNLGCAQEAQAKLPEALQSFDKVVALEREMADAWNWVGVLRFRLDRLPEARTAYLRCLLIDKKSAKALHNLGMLYQRLGDPEKSAHYFAEAEKAGGVKETDGVVSVRLFYDRDPREG